MQRTAITRNKETDAFVNSILQKANHKDEPAKPYLVQPQNTQEVEGLTKDLAAQFADKKKK